jgi:hypothetical protein
MTERDSELRRWIVRGMKRRRPRDRKRRLFGSYAVHEVGHAIAYLVLDQPFKFVVLGTYKPGHESFGHFIYGRPKDCFLRSPDDPVVVEYVEHNLIMTYAAGAAERLFFPHARSHGDKTDVEIAAKIIRKLRRGKKAAVTKHASSSKNIARQSS